MTGKYQRYPDYRDSGVEWWGTIPKHWKVGGFKKFLNNIVDYRGKTPEKTDSGVPLVTARNIKNGTVNLSLSEEFVSPEQYEQIMSRGKPAAGDLLFTTEAPLGEVALVKDENIALAQRIIKFTPSSSVLISRFLKYLISSEEFQTSLKLHASGSTVLGIKAERLVYLRTILPPIAEQNAIVGFLDHETTKIDALIAKQEKLIELLKEKRQAVISHAVTKGLNPDVPMKDSGVEWLGEVPEHWNVLYTKHLFNFVTSGSRGWAEYYSDEGDLFFRIANLHRDQLEPKLENLQHVKAPKGSEGERARIKNGDLLISITADLGSICVANSDISGAYVSQHVCLARPSKMKVLSEFLGYALLSDPSKTQLLSSGYGGTKVQLSLHDVKSVIICLPPLAEQEHIVGQIRERDHTIRILTKKVTDQIRLLRERKSSLISAAVTGKIDVRHHASHPAGNAEICEEVSR